MKKLINLAKCSVAAFASMAFIGLGSLPAQAAVVTSGCALSNQCSLQELSSGSSFLVDSQTYDGWFFDSAFDLNSPDGLSLALDAIYLTPFAGLDGLAGFNISGSGFGEPVNADWAISFGFTVNSSTPLLGAGLEFPHEPDDSGSFAMASLSGGSYADTAVGIPGFGFDELAVIVTEPGVQALDVFTTLFIQAARLLDVNQVFVSVTLPNGDSTGSDGPGGAGGAGVLGDPVGVVPEPATLLLALTGLGAIGVLRRRPQLTI